MSEAIREVVDLPTSLGEALNGDRSFIFSIPELDCYRSWRQTFAATEYVSVPIAPLPLNAPSPTNQPWTYLSKDYTAYEIVLRVLNTESPFQPLQNALVDKSLAVHHGGVTTTIACFLAGIPQIILPRYVEQQLNGAALLPFNVAQILINPTEDEFSVAYAQATTLVDPACPTGGSPICPLESEFFGLRCGFLFAALCLAVGLIGIEMGVCPAMLHSLSME